MLGGVQLPFLLLFEQSHARQVAQVPDASEMRAQGRLCGSWIAFLIRFPLPIIAEGAKITVPGRDVNTAGADRRVSHRHILGPSQGQKRRLWARFHRALVMNVQGLLHAGHVRLRERDLMQAHQLLDGRFD